MDEHGCPSTLSVEAWSYQITNSLRQHLKVILLSWNFTSTLFFPWSFLVLVGSILISQMFAPVPQFWQQLTSAWDKNGTKIKQRGKNNDYKTETKQRNYLETEIHRKYIFQNISKSFRTSKLDWKLSYLVSSPRLTSACGFLQ